MKNFFSPIPTEEGNIYFLVWLLNSSKSQNAECFEKAALFISECYKKSKVQAPQNIHKLEVLDIGRVSIYCMVNNEDLIVIKTAMSNSLYRLISTKHYDNSSIHISEISKENSANKYIYVFLEVQYIGNLLQIGQETIYDVFSLERYVSFLVSNKNKCSEQIFNELAVYETAILDKYRDHLNIKYEDWSPEQYKGFFRDLQIRLNDGEGKNDNEFGVLWYFDLFELKQGNAHINFRLKHNTNTVDIRAGFSDSTEKKIQRPILIKKIENLFVSKNIKFKKQSRPGRSLYTTLGTIVDPVIKVNNNGLIDMDGTINQLKSLKQIVDN